MWNFVCIFFYIFKSSNCAKRLTLFQNDEEMKGLDIIGRGMQCLSFKGGVDHVAPLVRTTP